MTTQASSYRCARGMGLLLAGLFILTPLRAAPAPSGLVWRTLETIPPIASPAAKVGGRLRLGIASFPLTLRQVGPDASQAFRNYLDENDMALVNRHPNTREWMPELATHWAFDPKEPRAVYYRLDPSARWSDGVKLKASDFVFTLSFMRSPFIKAPWYNDYYSKTIDRVTVLEDRAFGEILEVRLKDKSPYPLFYANLKPLPEHFYGKLDENFISSFNWRIPPNLGPYILESFRKGKDLTFRRKPQWWAKDRPFFKNRFNIDEVVFKVVRDPLQSYEYLKLGELDAMSLSSPELWHGAEKDEAFRTGAIRRLQAYNEVPRSDYVLILNNAYPLFKSKKVREAFQYAMNVDRVIKELLRGDYQRLQGISQGYGAYTDQTIKARGFDVQRANNLLDEEGWTSRDAAGIRMKGAERLEATVSYSPSTLTARLVVLREEALKAGIDFKLQQGEDASVFKAYLDKRHEIAVMNWGTPFRPEYRSRFHSSHAFKPQTSNFSNTADPALDQLIEEYEHADEEAVRIAKAHAIQQFIHADASHIPLFEVPYYRLAYGAALQFPRPSGTKTTDGLYLFDSGNGGLVWIDSERAQAERKGSTDLGVAASAPWIDETFREAGRER